MADVLPHGGLDRAQDGVLAAQLVLGHVAVDRADLEEDHGPLGPQVVEGAPGALALGHDRQRGDLGPSRGERTDRLAVGCVWRSVHRFVNHHLALLGCLPAPIAR